MTHIHKLTGLRGLAAFIVFISHSANESILPRFFGEGYGQIGVMLFFVLSGFLMSYLYINEEFNQKNVRKYFLARIGRVFPLYFTILSFSFLITHYISSESFFPFKFYEVDIFLRALLLIEAPYLFWTIPVEIQFYVVFVAFWALYQKGSNAYLLFLFIILTMVPSIVLYRSIHHLPAIVSSYSYAFFLGSITALLFEKIKLHPNSKRISNIIGFPALVLLFINLPELRVQFGLVFSENFYLKTWGDPITWIIVYTVFLCAALNAQSLFVLNTRFFVYLGNISYGFYLIHYPVLMFCVKEVNIALPAKFILAFFLAVALSHVSFYYFEKPASIKIRQFGRSKLE